jgi:asparagine synthase (glutamine-hydrolysing)
MCGLAGFTHPGNESLSIISSMLDTLIHRGPDSSGTHISSNIVLGHRRLVIIDPNGGLQPRVDAANNDALIFNGEIYNYRKHAKDLRAAGVHLVDDSDTEVLFKLLQHYGVRKTLELVDGMFAFAYFEGKTRTLSLVRDRFGEKPLFYGISNGQLVFASELKAIRRHPKFRDTRLDPNSIHRFLTFEYLPGVESGYEHIYKLQPGTIATYKDGSLKKQRYWQPRVGVAPSSITEEDALDELDRLLSESVQQRLVADVPVGLFLSGGVDSGLLASIAGRQASNIKAYTVKMPDQSYDETPEAKRIAQHCGIGHEILELGESDVVNAFNSITKILDEPLSDYSLLPTFMVCKAARQNMTVALGGDGGDELFGGYSSFNALRLAKLMQFIPRVIGRLLRSILDITPDSGSYMSNRFVARHVSQGFGMPVDRQNFYWMAPFTDQEKESLWHDDFRPHGTNAATFKPILNSDENFSSIEQLLSQFTRYYLPEDILTKIDRASMMNSMEVRAPFLSKEFSEFSLSLPSHWKAHGGKTKILLKKLAERHLPSNIVHQPKHGFGLPLSALLRGPFKEHVKDVLLDSNNPVAGWFKKPIIESILSSHMDAGRDHRKKIWTLFILFSVAARKA